MVMKKTLICLIVAFVAPVVLATSYSKYAVLSVQDKAFFDEVRTSILGEQPEMVAKLVLYPIEIVINSESVKINSEQEFVRRYNDIVTPDLLRIVRNQKTDELFKNWRGIMVGRGELWFGQVQLRGDSSYTYRITGISPSAIHD